DARAVLRDRNGSVRRDWCFRPGVDRGKGLEYLRRRHGQIIGLHRRRYRRGGEQLALFEKFQVMPAADRAASAITSVPYFGDTVGRNWHCSLLRRPIKSTLGPCFGKSSAWSDNA